MTDLKIKPVKPEKAYNGSYYTILGVGGEISEWVDGYEKALSDKEIGKPTAWYTMTGRQINQFANPSRPEDAFPDTLIALLFPHEGLDMGKLAIFKLQWEDRWFDDIVDNITRRNHEVTP